MNKKTGYLISLHQKLTEHTDNTDAATGRIQIFPDGKFYAKDDRFPKGWELTAEIAAKIIAASDARKDDYLIDYEHQALLAEKNGQPVVAAGWFKDMEYVDGAGLFANVAWTQKASQMIKAREYRYISPTFRTDANGTILSLFNVALTNTPAIDGMTNVVALAEDTRVGDTRVGDTGAAFDVETDLTRDNFSLALKKLLGLSDDISDDQLIGAVKEMLRQVEYLTEQSKDFSKNNGNPDPAKFVPLSALTEVQSQLALVLAREHSRAVDALINQGKADGKIVPATESWAREYAAKDYAGAKEYLANTAPIVALNQTQTGGIAPLDDQGITVLSELEQKIQLLTGIKPVTGINPKSGDI